MQHYDECPPILREFLTYHKTIKGQSRRTISEYHLDLRMFLRFLKLMRSEFSMKTPLEDVPIHDIDLEFIRQITTAEVFDFLSYLSNDRELADGDTGISATARARKLPRTRPTEASQFAKASMKFSPSKKPPV